MQRLPFRRSEHWLKGPVQAKGVITSPRQAGVVLLIIRKRTVVLKKFADEDIFSEDKEIIQK